MAPLLPVAIAGALQRGATVLTANQRAARTLRQTFDSAMHSAGHHTWPSPSILSLATWMSSLWSTLLLNGADSRILLNRVQEHSLWHSILSSDRAISGLRSLNSLAESSAHAWRLVHLYNARPLLKDFGASVDTRAFQRWALEFERRCDRNLYLTSAQLPGALEQALSRGDLDLSDAGLVLVDFDRLPPAQQQLFESTARAGYPVEPLQTAHLRTAHLQASVQASTLQLWAASDPRNELQTAAAWARQQLEQLPDARIAVVVPSLDDRRGDLERVFSEVLAPQDQPINTPAAPPPYEFSLGRPLADTAAVSAALDLLRWSIEPLPLTSVSALLLSPFFGTSASSVSTRPQNSVTADFDAFEVRTMMLLQPQLSLGTIIDLTHASKRRAQLGELPARLRSMQKVAAAEHLSAPSNAQPNAPLNVQPNVQMNPSSPSLKSHAEWADAFRNLLEAAGWTRCANLDSITFQTYRRWESVLDELASLDFDGTRPIASVALATLTRIVRQTIFAPESQQAPVQILGPLELGGVPFDALWFMGADDLSWPTSVSRHPLLPSQIQRSLGMPGTDRADEMASARVLTERIARSAATVVFSFTRTTEEGERQVSSALDHLALTAFEPLELPQPAMPLPLEMVLDEEPLPLLPDRVIRGGAQILELQAACGFRAFAERRLWSTAPGFHESGLDARHRGSVVHTIMEAFWRHTANQSELRRMTEHERYSFLDECIEAALSRAAKLAHGPWETTYLDIQRQRLRTLLRPWLQQELERPPFSVRDQEKDSGGVQIGPLKLNIRVDRIDQTAAGLLILDYKTGAATPSDWLSARPDAPQLPLYATLSDPAELAGVAFALLRPGKDLALKGYAAHPTAVFAKPSNIPAGSLAAQAEEWRQVLTTLAIGFAEGDARVAPKCYPKTCSRCSQRILCRLDVTTLEDLGDEDEDFAATPGEFAPMEFTPMEYTGG